MVCYNKKKKHIALTYDDGPRTASTGKILDALEKYNFRATFFVVGENVGKKTAKVLKREKPWAVRLATIHTVIPNIQEYPTAGSESSSLTLTAG